MNSRDNRPDRVSGRQKAGKDGYTTSGVFLTGRQVSWSVSSGIMLCFFVFISGYFLGKKKAVEKFYKKIEQDSFADQIYYSMCSMYDKGDLKQADGQDSLLEGNENKASTPLVAATAVAQRVDADSERALSSPQGVGSANHEKNKQDVQKSKDDGQFYAELCGYGTLRAAKRFANKLLSEGVTVSVKNRRSKTARGRIIVWYQVVTGTFNDKNDLIALVDDISAQEKLKDVRIVSC